MALPTFQSVSVLFGSSNALSTVAWPSHQADDIGLLLVHTSSTQPATLSVAAGFVALPDNPQDTGGGVAGCSLSVFWCRATSGAMGNPTIADSGNHQIAGIVVVRGCVTTGNPWDVTAGAIKATASTAMSIAAVTTTVTDCLLVLIAAHALDSKGGTDMWSSLTNASLANLTERLDASRDDGAGGGFLVATGEKAVAGATGTTTATLATSSVEAYMVFALTSPTSGGGSTGFGSLLGTQRNRLVRTV